MNDNRPIRHQVIAILDQRADRYIGFQEEANPCHCGCEKLFVKREVSEQIGRRRFVWCMNCGAEGPRTPTEETAISQWNRETRATAH